MSPAVYRHPENPVYENTLFTSYSPGSLCKPVISSPGLS